MTIQGREPRFRMTVGASAEIAKLCPGGDISRIGEVVGNSTNYADNIDFIVKFLAVMSKWGEIAAAYEEKDYKPKPLTENELYSLDMETLTQLQNEAFAVYIGDVAPTVEAEPEKK